jgi:hypothetical protein
LFAWSSSWRVQLACVWGGNAWTGVR